MLCVNNSMVNNSMKDYVAGCRSRMEAQLAQKRR
jgi:hypothetical protein